MTLPCAILSATNSECGSHAEGIVAYSVNGPGCCTSEANEIAFIHDYQLNEGVWQHSGITQIHGSSAQLHCCLPT